MCTARSSSHLLGGLPQCMLGYTPRCGPGDPPSQTHQPPHWVWAWRPPWPDPLTSPLGVGLETPQPDPLTPLGVGLETPQPDPSTSTPGCGPGDPPGQTHQPPPWVWAWRTPQPDPSTSPLGVGLETSQPDPLTSSLGVGLETPPGQTDTCKT